MAKRVQSGRREEMKGGRTQRRMPMAFRWVRLERPLCSAWTRQVRFPGVRALGGSSVRRLGGLTGRQLTGPVAEAPEVNLRRSARSDHETELAARSPGGADANSSFSVGASSRKKSYYEKYPCPGVCIQPPSQAGVGFESGVGSHGLFWSCPIKREMKLRRKKGPALGGVDGPPLGSAWGSRVGLAVVREGVRWLLALRARGPARGRLRSERLLGSRAREVSVLRNRK